MTKGYKTSGTITSDAFYVERLADKQLFEELAKGEYCYILTCRQVGKSSLCIRAKNRLEKIEVLSIYLDIQEIGITDQTQNLWYCELITRVKEGLKLNFDLNSFFEENENKHPKNMWLSFLKEKVLALTTQPIVIFIDEIDLVLSLPFSSDDFFTSLRHIYNGREEFPEYKRLTFCLIGVVAPTDLIKDPNYGAFNIGKEILLQDFTLEETKTLVSGLPPTHKNLDELLKEVYNWTSGHPYMTLNLCEALRLELLVNNNSESEEVLLTRLVKKLFLQKSHIDINLSYAEKRLDLELSKQHKLQMLETYKELLTNVKYINKIEEIYFKLKLTGMITIDTNEQATYLKARNKIYTTFYDKKWVELKQGERLLTTSLENWLEFNKANDFLLRGQALQKALDWQRTQLEITALEREFISASQEMVLAEQQNRALQQEQIALFERQQAQLERERAEALETLLQEQKQRAEIERLAKEQQTKSNSRLRKVSAGLAAIALFAIIASIFAGYNYFQAKDNEQKANEEAKQKTEALARIDEAYSEPSLEGSDYIEDLGDEIKIGMVLVKEGTFQMGSPSKPKEESRSDDETLHTVKVSEFYMGKYEVTQKQWRKVASSLPKVEIELPIDPSVTKGDNLPVESISWEEAVEFCKRLSRKAGKKYRLPTEAEWEYAARAGSTGAYAGNLDEMGWYYNNSNNRTHRVGKKKPNAWGLYDMHGNVYEWCSDWYGDYPNGTVVDPRGPESGSFRVIRGGSFSSFAQYCRSAFRSSYSPVIRYGALGFRLLRTLK